jgi:hypothetical protein
MKKETFNSFLKFGSGIISGFILSLFFSGSAEYLKPFFEALFLSIVSALATFFLEFCFREGNIFAGWIRFLNRYFYENEKNPFRFLYKPLGGCALCMNIWLTTFFFFAFFFAFGSSISFLWYLLPVLFISHLILFFTFKHFDFES